MSFYTKRANLPPGVSYMRFLLFCAFGFSIGGVALLVLGGFVFEPNHEAIESSNVEASIAFTGGCLCFGVAVIFAVLAILQYRKVKQMRDLANRLLLDGQENTLYQVIHQNTPLPRKPLVTAVGSPAPPLELATQFK